MNKRRLGAWMLGFWVTGVGVVQAAPSGPVTDVISRSQAKSAKSSAAIDEMISLLATGVVADDAVALIAALGKRGEPRALPVLMRYAQHRDVAVRVAALDVLLAFKAPEAKALVLGALGSSNGKVRAAAAATLARAGLKDAVPRLMALLKKSEAAAGAALATLAVKDKDLVTKLTEQVGEIPDEPLATCLGLILLNPAVSTDDVRSLVVGALAKIPGAASLATLTEYIDKTPATPPRASRKEAEAIVESRLGGS